jgi:hypothetical protein
VIELSDAQMVFAAEQAEQRHRDAKAHKQRHYFTPPEGETVTERRACEAEMAAGIGLGVPWRGAGCYATRLDGDLAYNIEVRGRKRSHDPLLMRREDKDDRPYVLVTGIERIYELRGWVYGHEGKDERYWWADAPYRPCFKVPQSDLRPIESLLVLIDSWRARD